MQKIITIGTKFLKIQDVAKVAHKNFRVKIHQKALQKLNNTRLSLMKMVKESKAPYYGINTGFGSLSERIIPHTKIEKLQKNLVVSHAVGVGEPFSVAQTRALMLIRVNTLLSGHSGCRGIVLEHLICLLNANCVAYVPSKGSVGASGDLAPLAHVALLLLGIGKAFVGKKIVSAKILIMMRN